MDRQNILECYLASADEKISGAMIPLMPFKNSVRRDAMSFAKSGKATPMAQPANRKTKIQAVREA